MDVNPVKYQTIYAIIWVNPGIFVHGGYIAHFWCDASVVRNFARDVFNPSHCIASRCLRKCLSFARNRADNASSASLSMGWHMEWLQKCMPIRIKHMAYFGHLLCGISRIFGLASTISPYCTVFTHFGGCEIDLQLSYALAYVWSFTVCCLTSCTFPDMQRLIIQNGHRQNIYFTHLTGVVPFFKCW